MHRDDAAPKRAHLMRRAVRPDRLPADWRTAAPTPCARFAARQKSRDALMKVTHYWGCQYQNVDLEAVARSDLDLIVLDPSLNDDLGRFVTQRSAGRSRSEATAPAASCSVGPASARSAPQLAGVLALAAWRKNVPDQ